MDLTEIEPREGVPRIAADRPAQMSRGGVEILNFAVGGYRITQMLYTLETKAAVA